MEDQELIGLWKKQETKIDQLMSINAQLLKERTSEKMRKALFGIKAEKVTGIVFGIVYIFFLGALLSIGLKATSFKPDFFNISVGVIFLVNIKVFADYIKHLVMANQIKFDGSVTEIQKQLLDLKVSLIKTVRIVVIQIPFYTTFHLSTNWFPSQASEPWVIVQLLITGIFTFAAAWVYFNFKPENTDKKWVKWMISSAGGTQIEKSLEQLKELEVFKSQ